MLMFFSGLPLSHCHKVAKGIYRVSRSGVNVLIFYTNECIPVENEYSSQINFFKKLKVSFFVPGEAKV